MRIAYIILGSVWILFLSSTEVKGECTKPTTTENAVIHEDDIDKETFADQDRVRLKCHPGYEPTKDSPMRLTCTGVQWIPPPERFNCKKKTCGNPGDIMYGKYEYLSGNEFGDIIQPQCNLGYYLLGSPDQQRVCMANGQWDGQEPVCEVIKCGAPPTITNGRPKFPPEDEYEYNHVVEYVCDAGTLLGDSSIRCLLNKSWSNAPQCKVVNCPKRPDIPNAERIGGNSGPYGYMATLTYGCVKGYRMAAGSTGTVVCKEMGWTHTLVCEVVTCAEPKNTNAVIESGAGGPYTVNWVLKYGCLNNMHLNGKHQLTCQSDGSWSSEPPVCEDKPMPLWKKVLIAILIILITILVAILVWWFCFRKKKNCHNDRAPKREQVKLNSHSSPESV